MNTKNRTTSLTGMARLFALGLLPTLAHTSPVPQYSSTGNTEGSSDGSLDSSNSNSSSIGSSSFGSKIQASSTSANSSSLVPLWGYCNGTFIGVSTPLPCEGSAQCICKDDSFAQCRVAVNGVWSWSPDWQCQQPGDTSHGLLSTYGMSNVSSQSTYTTPGNYGSTAATASGQVNNSTTSGKGEGDTTSELSTGSGSFMTIEPGASSASGAGVTNGTSTGDEAESVPAAGSGTDAVVTNGTSTGDNTESMLAAGSGKDATGANNTSSGLDSGSATNTTTGTGTIDGESNGSSSTSTSTSSTSSSGSTATSTSSSSVSHPSGDSGSTITSLFQSLAAGSRGKPNNKAGTKTGSSLSKSDTLRTSLQKTGGSGGTA